MVPLGFPGGAVIKNPRANAGDTRDAGLISGSGSFPGNSKPLQYSCLEKIHRQKSPAGYSPWNSLGQNTGVGSLSLLQGIFLAQDLNRGLLNCRQILYLLNYQKSP